MLATITADYGAAVIGGAFAIVGVVVSQIFTHNNSDAREARKTSIMLAQLRDGVRRLERSHEEMWPVLDDVRDRLARIEGPTTRRPPHHDR